MHPSPVGSEGNKYGGPTFCIQHSSCLWGCQKAGRMKTGKRCTRVSVGEEHRNQVKKKIFSFSRNSLSTQTRRDLNLGALQVDVLQVAVVEVEVAAVSFLVGELYQVCGRQNTIRAVTLVSNRFTFNKVDLQPPHRPRDGQLTVNRANVRKEMPMSYTYSEPPRSGCLWPS